MQIKKVLALLFSITVFVSRSLFAQPLIQAVQQVSPDDLPDAEEVSIVINPHDPSNLAVGSNPGYFFHSNNFGQSWPGDGLSSSYGEAGDPSLTADSKGNIYYAHLSTPSPSLWLDRMVIQKSSDGGKTYSDGTFTGHISPKQQDKETIICDNSQTSPHHDNLYMSWTEFDSYQSHFPKSDSSRILFSRSTDEGETWSQPIIVSDRDGDCADSSNTDEGATCATAPNGDIYITWSSHAGLMFDKSTDGGKTFGKDRVIDTLTPGWDFPVAGISRCNGLPTTLCDLSNTKHRGNLYVVFSDKRNGANNTDVFLLRSRDGGNLWDQPIRINNDTTQFEQFMPASTIDQVTGIIYCVFYDRRNTNGGTLTDVYLARSVDGGSTFTNYRLTQNPFPCNSPLTFFGDYIGIAANNTKVYPIWMQDKQQTTELYMALVIDTGAFRDAVQLPQNGEDYALSLGVSPNPANTVMHFKLTHAIDEYCSVLLTDVMGRTIETIYKGRPTNTMEYLSYNTSRIPNGIYYCIAQSKDERRVQKIVISH